MESVDQVNGTESEGAAREVEWREYDFHNDNDGREVKGEETARKNKNALNSLFNDDEELDEFEFKYRNAPPIVLQGESHCGWTRVLKSTGLAVWEGADRLSAFMAEHPQLVRSRRCLELGSGTGMCSILAHHLGAKSVIATDGDYDALQNLKVNVQQNVGDAIDSYQLIWGQDIELFLEKFGEQDVIFLSDCVYMEKGLRPLWETIDRILIANKHGSADGDGGIVIYVNNCISQVPLDKVVDVAREHFNFVKIDHSPTLGSSFSDVHIFRRKQLEQELDR